MHKVNLTGKIALEIINIYPDSLFAVKFDGKDQNEYEAAFTLWQDLDYLVEFFDDNKDLIDTDFWKAALPSIESEDLAASVVDESFDLLDYIQTVAKIPQTDMFLILMCFSKSWAANIINCESMCHINRTERQLQLCCDCMLFDLNPIATS